jgi:hypothetical protein
MYESENAGCLTGGGAWLHYVLVVGSPRITTLHEKPIRGRLLKVGSQ